jgi:aspartate kinase
MTNIIITENQSIVTLNNVPIHAVLEQAAAAGINIDMIAQAPATSDKISFAFTISDNDMTKLLSAQSFISCGNVKITVKSDEMAENTGFAAKVFAVLKKLGCRPLLVTTALDEISLLIEHRFRDDLERELKTVFAQAIS